MSQRRAWDMCQRGLRAAVHEELPCLGKVQINQRNEMKLVNRSHRFIGYCISLVWLQLPAKQDHSLNMRNCLKYCLVDKAWPRCNLPFKLMITMTICLLTLLPPPTHRRRGKNPPFAVGGRGELSPPLTHRRRGKNPPFAVGGRGKLPPPPFPPPPTAKGGTHPTCGVGPPARWADSYFPRVSNIASPPTTTVDTLVTGMGCTVTGALGRRQSSLGAGGVNIPLPPLLNNSDIWNIIFGYCMNISLDEHFSLVRSG